MAAGAERLTRWSLSPSPLLADAVLGYLVTMAVGVAVFTSPRPAGSTNWPAYAFAVGFGLVLLWRRQYAVLVLLITSLGICVYYTLDYPPIGLALPIAAAVFSVAENGHLRVGIAVSAVLVALAVGFQVADGRAVAELLGYEVPPVIALMGAALALGDGTRTRRLLRAEQLRRERQARLELEHQVADQRAAERVSLARDLHDTLGHHLSVILLQSAVAAEALPGRVSEAQRAAGEVRRVGREAMAELRDTVTRLRSLDGDADPAAGLDRLPELVERAQRSGLDVHLRAGADQVPAQTGQAAYLIVQEAVTNVIRHAHATTIDLVVAAVDGRLRVRVEDDGLPMNPRGHPPEETAPQLFSGNGIRGMRERAESLGGQLTITARSTSRGVTVCADLPLPLPTDSSTESTQ